jgi:hypothetical protein
MSSQGIPLTHLLHRPSSLCALWSFQLLPGPALSFFVPMPPPGGWGRTDISVQRPTPPTHTKYFLLSTYQVLQCVVCLVLCVSSPGRYSATSQVFFWWKRCSCAPSVSCGCTGNRKAVLERARGEK